MSDRLEQLRALRSEDPADLFLRYAIALELKRRGNLTEALNDLEALARDEPKHIATYYQLASMLAEAGRIDDAIAACDSGALHCLVAGERKTRTELMSLKANLQGED